LGGVERGLSERSEFRSAQLFEAAQEISGGGCLFVWLLYFGQAK
jgi:hypothetical protein